jgi:stage V sporulation protein B
MLVSGLSCYRGYAQGHRHMVPSSVSQIIESVFKLVIGLPLAWYAMNILGLPDHMGAAAAIVGITASEVIALVYMTLERNRFRRLEPPGTSRRTTPYGVILGSCLGLAVPITLTSASASLITLVDNALVLRRLQHAGLMLPEDGARALMSNYSVVQTIYQIPAALMVAITASVIPAVTACFTRRDRKGAARIVGSSLKMAALVAMPSGAIMFVLGTPITQMFFPSYSIPVAGTILSILGIANVFVCLMLVCNSILQSHGVLHLPIVTMIMGGVTMVLFDYFMVGTVRFNIFGSPIGTCICYSITCILDLAIVHRIVPGCPSYHKVFGRTLLASAAMGAVAWWGYGFALPRLGNTLSVACACVVSGLVYLVLVLLLHILSREDLSLMPKGDKIARLLRVK